MAQIKQVNEQIIVDYMARDYDSLLRSMRKLIPYKLPEWTEYESEADFGNVLLQLFAHMGDILSYYQDRIVNESFLGTAQNRRSIIDHLRLIGYRLATAGPASALLTLYFPADCTETITISRGNAFATKSTKENPSVRFEYTAEHPLTIECSILPVDATTGKKYFEGVPVEEGRLVEDEFVGASDGTPNQRFKLAHPALILRSLGQGQIINRDIILRTQSGQKIDEWTLQESLAFSREDQQDFALEIDELDQATILFGDGDFGAIPPTDAVITATYRVGGGVQGNVPAGSIQTISDASQLLLLGAEITNPQPATGGADREKIEHAVKFAPSVFRSLKRAVTADDYRALALEFSGVAKVRAEATEWNIVALYVAPEGGGQVSDVLEANLLAYFEDKRSISTHIEIKEVDYVKIYITAEIEVIGYYDGERVKENVEEAGAALLAFDNVDFAQPIYLSKFYEAIEGVDGVKYVNIIEFVRSDLEQEDIADYEKDTGRGLYVARRGKIELDVNEISCVPNKPDKEVPLFSNDPDSAPDDADYANGIRVIVLEEDTA